ncbi:glycolate oxidase subunit GlcE [Piscinibacter koreensis]|uniref:Glycolate oxidase subunit GlcE n=1 Tax=Piscinibacter koreensis TaxID=2742824 RepID=A0A7Y6NJ95_9BURK|nr:glycolate oxidase subunit GlcE [Schlegelella koreensis]NUZ04197.1 glycolate oxidase subunit GlcE [Schlegelella koreensis]
MDATLASLGGVQPAAPLEPRSTGALADAIEQVRAAHASGRPLRMRGGGSKDFYGEAPVGDVLDTRSWPSSHVHEPTELVVVAGAAMRVADLEAVLAAHDQHLAFEPPRFALGSTVGGMVAAGLSGPARASAGAVRDHVLGVTLLSGRGELLSFGGQVIKNVAGYDVSRLVAGSLGLLGAIVDVSLKVLPRPAATATLRFDLNVTDALTRLNRWGGQPLPLNASAWWNGSLVVRLAGAAAAVAAATRTLGGDVIEPAAAERFWTGLRDQTDEYFAAAHDAVAHQDAALWRVSLPQTAPPLGLAGDELIEWHGAQRWLVTALPAAQVRAAAAAAGGHATIFRARDKSAGVFTPLAPPLQRIHERLKDAFDPKRILNPGRLYPGL